MLNIILCGAPGSGKGTQSAFIAKKYGVSDQFIAYLVDGQGNPYGGQTVNFNIHGVFYERVTDSDGRAILNIRLGAASDVYIITSEYNGCRITNTITIVP